MTIEPKKQTLRHDPIVEALFEVRFSCKEGLPGHLLPGILYPAIRERFPNSQSLDINKIPIEIRENDPNLRYTATQRFSGEDAIINIGPRVFTIASARPYMGWSKFKPIILDCLSQLSGTGFVEKTERFSLRYVNIIPAGKSPQEQFSKIYFNGNLGNFDLTNGASQISTEIPHRGLLNKVNISSNANVEVLATGEITSGLLLDIDTIQLDPPGDFWKKPEEYIEAVHESETDIFFGTVTKQTLAEYGYTDE